jgi:hypothetical protein
MRFRYTGANVNLTRFNFRAARKKEDVSEGQSDVYAFELLKKGLSQGFGFQLPAQLLWVIVLFGI